MTFFEMMVVYLFPGAAIQSTINRVTSNNRKAFSHNGGQKSKTKRQLDQAPW